MKLAEPLHVHLLNKHGTIVAIARQVMFGKEVEGTNILRGKKPKSFLSARSMVQVWALKNNIPLDDIVFHEERQTWE